jgi:ribonuclease D
MISKPAMLQIASEGECLLIRLCQLGDHLPENLIKILQNPNIKKVGRGILHDKLLMNAQYSDLDMQGVWEIKGNLGLKKQANASLNMNLNPKKMKQIAMSDWEKKDCHLQMLEYAALDAIISRKLFIKLGGQIAVPKKKKQKRKVRQFEHEAPESDVIDTFQW